VNNTGTKEVSIMKQTAFWREKNGEYREGLKYSVPIFVELIYKMQRLQVSGAVRPIYGSLGGKRLTIVIEVIVGTKRVDGRRLMFLFLNGANFEVLYDMIRYLFTAIGFPPGGSGR